MKLPEVELINDKTIRNETRKLVGEYPDYFWEVPAATTYRHHNPYCCDKYGLWIHTKMVCTAYLRMVPSLVHQDKITEYEADCGLAACILHDSWKNGDGDGNNGAVQNHDIIAAKFIEQNSGLPSMVSDCVASHMGPWYAGPEPKTTLEQLVHMADMSASSVNSTHGLYKPHDKIANYYPSIPRARFKRGGLYR